MVLAGGRGERMAAGRNKALLELAGRPLLLHSVEVFEACCDRVLVVSAEVNLAEMARLLPPRVSVVAGGTTRHGSEWNALAAVRGEVSEADVVAFHDAARPLVDASDVRAVLAATQAHGAAMLAVSLELPALQVSRMSASPPASECDPSGRVSGLTRPSIPNPASPISELVPPAYVYSRAELWRAQTPQAARAGWLIDAYERAASDGFDGTDTAAVLARAGYAVYVVGATAENPKVTVPGDLPRAEVLLRSRSR